MAEVLDYFFPFFVLLYGCIMIFVLKNPFLIQLAEQRLRPYLWQHIQSHLILGWICFVVGLLWSLQNLFL